MRPSTTAPVSSDAPAAAPAASLAPGPLVALKIVLGVIGLAGCVLLGAGGAWLVKHFLMADPHAGAPLVQAPPPAAPAMQTPAVAALPASAAAPVTASAQAIAVPTDVPVATIEQAPPSAGQAAPGEGAVVAAAAPYATTSPVPVKPSRVADAGAHAATARADKAKCLARVNAITADLSLRNEPPTPEQLAILKRGCK